jgi:putative nucleotidyltransferase with HDIG domain
MIADRFNRSPRVLILDRELSCFRAKSFSYAVQRGFCLTLSRNIIYYGWGGRSEVESENLNLQDTLPFRILVVDSDVMIRQVLNRILQREGFLAETADSGSQAISMLNSEHFDFLITDVNSSQTSMTELLERIRMLFPDTLVIVTASPMEIDLAVNAIRLGAAGFVLKPFRIEEIRLSLRTAIENRQFHEERGRVSILTSLVEAGKEISTSFDIDSLAEKIVEYAVRITQADTASLLLIDSAVDELVTAASIGLKEEYGRGFRKPASEGIAGWAIQRCFSLNLKNDEVFTPELSGLLKRSQSIRSSICMPMLSEGKPLGVININRLVSGKKKVFDSSDVDFISILSSQAAISIRNSVLFQQVQNLYEGSIQALSNALQAKDTYTGGHSERVAHFAMMLAENMGLSLPQRQMLWTAAILHDLGKIGTPEDILNKPSLLTGEEWQIIRNHPSIGAEIVRSVPALQDISSIILYHHERFDGTGYPAGLIGQQIPLGARILSVADALEAMTSNRPYRKISTTEKILEELSAGAGTQFDPQIVEFAVRLLDDNKISFVA